MARFKIPLGKERAPDPPKPRKQHFKGSDKEQLFDSLFACQWRGVPFPVSSIRVSLNQDLVQHKYWGVDVADVEATGRAPMEIEAVIPFVNGIVPGKNERWGLLYPTEFLRFLQAFVDRTTGLLTTPEIANITCKPVSLEYGHDAQQRDGVVVTARWIETVDADADANVEIAPLETAKIAALNLDAAGPSLQGAVLPPKNDSFEALMNKVTGFVDTSASRIGILLNKPAQVLYHVKRLQDSLERAGDTLAWPAEEACERIKEVLGPAPDGSPLPRAVDRLPLRKIGRFRTQTRMSLSMLQGMFPNNTVDDLIFLNPQLVARPVVPPQTLVRHYFDGKVTRSGG